MKKKCQVGEDIMCAICKHGQRSLVDNVECGTCSIMASLRALPQKDFDPDCESCKWELANEQ